MSVISDKYVALGGAAGFLGAAKTPEQSCPDGVGRFRYYTGGAIYWHPLTGACEVHGLILSKWAKLGYEKSVLGYPKTDQRDSGNGEHGKYNLFQGGAITWKSGAAEAFETHGAIRSKFGQFDFEGGLLGFPTTDESKTSDGVGRFNHFEHGSIYWKPTLSAHAVHGIIRDYWMAHDWERNPELGYPIRDEQSTFQGSSNRFHDFENGVLYWKHGAEHAKPVPRLVIGDASKTVGEVMAGISGALVSKLQTNESVYIKSGPSLSGIGDYSFNGSRVINRRYLVRVVLGVDIPLLPDPTVTIDFAFSIGFDRAAGKIWMAMLDAFVHAHVPPPTSAGLSGETLKERFLAVLNPLVGVRQNEVTLPDGIHLLSAKVMPNGDLNIYVQPL